ncbi:MAG: hypothetical protein Q8N23_20460 [Archangium sp.]|nr:hypothetical protein [Archangium sp.]MDP3572084.1 hypothetical protein [Archangium sp.]
MVLVALLASGCVSTSAQLQRDAEQCDSFAEFDARVRGELDALLLRAPGETLVRESSRLNAARRSCARKVISGLLTLREERGIEAVQQELNALSATYRSDELRALMSAALGDEVVQLEPLLAEARVRATRQGGSQSAQRRDELERDKLKVEAPDAMGTAPESPTTMCDEHSPCAQLRCVLEHPPASPDAAARACLDEAATFEPAERARRAAGVLSLLPASPGPARTEARLMLETLRTQLWPQVEAAVAAKKRGHAAQVASLFLGLPAVSAQVEKLRDAAQAHHLARAKGAPAGSEWLHRELAAEFGGPEAPELGGVGRWEPPRWRCKTPPPEMPALAAGLSAMVTGRCESPASEKRKDDSAMRTFELESSLRGQRVEGSVRVTCADRSVEFPLMIQDPGVEGFPERALMEALERTVGTAAAGCVRTHEQAVSRSCELISTLSPDQIVARFVEHWRFLHRWAPCFEAWLLAHEGVLPPLPARAGEVGRRLGEGLRDR